MKKFFYLLLASALPFTFTSCADDDDDDSKKGTEVVQPQISIQSNGHEIKDGDVITYVAEEDELFGDIVAGHASEPSFIPTAPCNMEVTIHLPQSDIKNLQWCGITHECIVYEKAGSYTRSIENMGSKESMEMHAYFNKGNFTECKVKVDVKINGKEERSFFINYVYSDKK